MTSETVLVVDDGQENLDFVVDYILKPNGFNALVAKDGREGLQMAVKHHPDLILLDLQMPRMDGREVLQALNQRELDIPVVLMTFHGSEEVVIEMFRLGVKDYVKKPYSTDEMLNAINRSLSESRLRREKEALTNRLLSANRELQNRVQELNILYRVGKTITSTVDLNRLLPQIIEAAILMTDAQESYVYLLQNGRYLCLSEKRVNQQRAQTVEYEADNAFVQHVVETGKQFLALREHFGNHPNQPLCAAYAPLILRGSVTGVLEVRNVSDDSKIFSQNDGALLSALTDYVAIGVENCRNFELLREREAQEKQQIRGTFERFVAPSVVEQALSTDGIKTGGVRHEITVLFADIRGYTSWSEKFPPEQVMEMLNNYLSLAAELVMGWEGTLDKFFGDGLMAIFNAPKNQSDHVHRAVDTALALLKAAEEMNQRKGYGLSYSVGVNVGEAVVGYIGTERALNYTAIGDVVNVAKRLQEAALPGQILVSDEVQTRLAKTLHSKRMGELKLRNRSKGVTVYAVDGLDPL